MMFGRVGAVSVTGATTAALSPEQAERVKTDATASAMNGAEIRISKGDLREIMQAQKKTKRRTGRGATFGELLTASQYTAGNWMRQLFFCSKMAGRLLQDYGSIKARRIDTMMQREEGDRPSRLHR